MDKGSQAEIIEAIEFPVILVCMEYEIASPKFIRPDIELTTIKFE